MKLSPLVILLLLYLSIELPAQDIPSNLISEIRVSLSVSDKSLEHVLQEITSRYNVEFSYSSNVIDVSRKVSIHVQEQPLGQVLNLLLEGFPNSYSIVKKRIVFSRKKPPLFQTVKGKIIDVGSKHPIAGATVFISGANPLSGAVTDEDGIFKIDNVPIGRQEIIVSHVSYEPFRLPSFLVISGKENIFFIELNEASTVLEEVVISDGKEAARYEHDLAVVGNHTIHIEEAKRYASSLNDPARMVSSAPGVAGDDFMENAIVIRGNSSRGLLWRVEGIDVPNPNHFAEEGDSGGGVSIINGHMLDHSHLLTGAFPSRYGNALSGVLDLRLRNGNNEKREYYFQASSMGLDMAAEGPFAKGKSASYLINYRYSSFSLLDKAGFSFSPSNTATRFQDLSFKMNFPTKKSGTFSFFGIGGLSSYQLDSSSVKGKYSSTMGILALSHDYQINTSTSLRSSISLSGTEIDQVRDYQSFSSLNYQYQETFIKKFARASVTINKKLSAHHLLEGGVFYSQMMFDFKDQIKEEIQGNSDRIFSFFDDKGQAGLTQGYLSWQSRIGEKWLFVNGLHAMHFGLNGKTSLEPRTSISYYLSSRHSLHAAYGVHSRIEPLQYYFARFIMPDQSEVQYNKDLGFTKARHYNLAYNFTVRDDLFFKAEAYYQDLYNIAVRNDSASIFSTISVYEGFTNFELINQGTGTNYGLEVSLEKSFTNNYYFNVNGSLFKATYVTKNFVERNTPYNGSFNAHILAGKVVGLGENKKNKTLSVNTRAVWRGGKRYIPINIMKSRENGTVVLDFQEAYNHQLEDYTRLDLQLTYRFNLPRYTGEWKLDVFNLTGERNITQLFYDTVNKDIKHQTQLGIFPVLSYRMEF